MKTIASNDDNFFLAQKDWTFPVPIAYGPGRLADIGNICRRLDASNPLIVTDSGSNNLPFIKTLTDHLNTSSLSSTVFSGISPNPRDDEIEAGCQAYRDGKHDAIIAIGGGSAMDGAKAIGMTVNSNVALWDFEYRKPLPAVGPDRPFPPFITIPTTAGTGAETESYSMVTDTEKGMKFCLAHPGMRPSQAILDPKLTVDLPAHLTAWTGVDALTHAVEAYIVPAFHPLSDGAALEGLKLIAKWLPTAFREPENIAARGAMLTGSCLAGIAFNKGLGLVHAISHMVGGEFNTQHGLTNAVILPVVMRFNLPGLDEKVLRMAQVMGLDDTSVDAVIAEIESLLDTVKIPKSLTEIGVPPDCAQGIAEKAMLDSAVGTNPRRASLEEVKALVENALRKAR